MKKFAILTLKPRSHVRILVYRTLASPQTSVGVRLSRIRDKRIPTDVCGEANRTWAIEQQNLLFSSQENVEKKFVFILFTEGCLIFYNRSFSEMSNRCNKPTTNICLGSLSRIFKNLKMSSLL